MIVFKLTSYLKNHTLLKVNMTKSKTEGFKNERCYFHMPNHSRICP